LELPHLTKADFYPHPVALLRDFPNSMEGELDSTFGAALSHVEEPLRPQGN